MDHRNLIAGPQPVYLPDDPSAAALASGADPASVAADNPACLAAWAELAEQALDRGELVAGYAYARTGYHRGLDQLRRAGWKGTARSPGNTSPTAVSCARCTRWAGPPEPSARPRKKRAARSSWRTPAPQRWLPSTFPD